jgi:hypothetical protein
VSGSTRARERATLGDGVAFCVLVFVGLRAAVSLLSVLGVGLVPLFKPGVGVPGWPAPDVTAGWHNAVGALERQDALWFLRIADAGYDPGDGSAAFFPLYPLLVRVVTPLTGGRTLLAALIVSNVSFLGALIVLRALTTLERSEAEARTAVVLLAVFPTSLFFLAPYSESTFLLLSVSAFWFARRDRWALAALAAALAATTRSIGIVLLPALFVEAVLQHRERGAPLLRRVAASVATLAGPGLVLLFWAAAFGRPLAPIDAQGRWQREATFPLRTLSNAVVAAGRLLDVWLFDALVVAVVVACLVAGLRSLRASYSVYAWASLAVPLSYPFAQRPLMSVPRFSVLIFPVFWVLADLVRRRRLPAAAVTAPFAAGLAICTLLFVNWYDIF